MVEHEGRVLLVSCGDDTKNDAEEVNTVIYGCLPLVYDMRDIIEVEDQVVVLADGMDVST
jgi:hypothetical protein